MEDGCFATDSTLGDWLGATARTVRRWRKELMSAGVLEVEETDRRHLIPTQPDNSVRTKMSEPDKNVRTNLSSPDKNVRDQPDKNVQHIEDNNTQAVGPESVHAREEQSTEPQGDGTAGGKPRVDDLDAITQQILDTRLRGLTQKDKIRQVCEKHGQAGWDVLREVCHEVKDNGWSVNGSVIFQRLTDQIQMLQDDEPERNDGFASKAERHRRAARRGAGLDG